MQFCYVGVFVQRGDSLYYGKWRERFALPQTLEDLQEVKRIQTEGRGPRAKPPWSAVYVKTPSLPAYINGKLEQQIAREKIIQKKPHWNIAVYYGYNETHGRVSDASSDTRLPYSKQRNLDTLTKSLSIQASAN